MTAARPHDRRVIVASFAEFAGDHPTSPRIQRTAHLVSALERQFDFRVTRVPGKPGQAAGPANATLPKRGARKALAPLVLESVEIPARLAMRGWKPSGRGALLIGWPFSPMYVAARHLVAAGIPYVVDIGDPWVLTEPAPGPWRRRLSLPRAEAAETFLWRHAAAGVVTTETQAESLRALFPDLELLVRPNGYLRADEPAINGAAAEAGPDRHSRGHDVGSTGELRLVHFGSMNPARLSIGDWLSSARRAAGLSTLHFANYGRVGRPELLQTPDPGVVVEVHDPVDWAQARQIACTFDAAVAVGNTDPATLPSKAIQYLTLPVPRIALTATSDRGELGAFAARSPGFIAVGLESREDIPRMITEVRRTWSHEELSPPPGDSWDEVAREVVEFAIEAWGPPGPPRPRDHGGRVATA